MAYLSLYRKYRSQGFDEILGQKHVTQTLKNALATGRVAHGYLFTGPRGTGKTSSARVLAKALNCLSFSGPTPDPCGACAACERIRDGRSLDVLEIDAASNRGIDDIRTLRERVGYAPVEERTKVYVIDEVHQLTPEAFNALLKTLEEPPPNVVFVLATTEVHKVPATIASRCQRYDFRRGGLDDVRELIVRVCNAEGWPLEPEAGVALAQAANGGYRDALTLLEQVAAYTGGEAITLDAVCTVLGSAGAERLFDTADAIAAHDPAACFRIVAEAMAEGIEVRRFLGGLRKHLRDALVASVGALGPQDVVLPAHADRLKAQGQAIPASTLVWAIDALNEAERDLRWAPDHRLLLETTLVKLSAGSAPAAPAAPSPSAAPQQRTPPPPRPPELAPAPRSERPAAEAGRRTEPARAGWEDRPDYDPFSIEGAPAPSTPLATTEPDFDVVVSAWNTAVLKFRGAAREQVRGMAPRRIERGALVIAGGNRLFVDKGNEKRATFERALSDHLGRPMRVVFEYDPSLDTQPAAKPSRPAAPAPPSLAELARDALGAEVEEVPEEPFVDE